MGGGKGVSFSILFLIACLLIYFVAFLKISRTHVAFFWSRLFLISLYKSPVQELTKRTLRIFFREVMVFAHLAEELAGLVIAHGST